MLTLKNIDRIFSLLFSKVPLRLSVSSAMGEDLTSLHAFRYADMVARYVSAWYCISPHIISAFRYCMGIRAFLLRT